MNRNFLKNCLIVGLIGLLIAAGFAAFWYWFYEGGSTAAPLIRLVQPASSLTINSGQGLVVIVEGQAGSDLDRIEFFVDGQLEHTASAFGESKFQAIFPWFSAIVGDHTLSAVGYDRAGRQSPSVSVMVRVQTTDVRAMLENAQPLDVSQTVEEIILQAEAANQGGGSADGNRPVDDGDAGQPGDPGNAGQPGDVPGDIPPAVPVDPGGAPNPPDPIPGEPPQADGEPPTAELIVTSERIGNAIAATLVIRSHDNVGLSLMHLMIQSPAGVQEQYAFGCDGSPDCSFEFTFPLPAMGEWIFMTSAIDLSGQSSLPRLGRIQIICTQELDDAHQPIIDCAVADENIPAAEDGDGVPPWANGGADNFWDFVGEGDVIFDPFDAAGGLLCRGIVPHLESFEINSCLIVQPVNLPGGPFTQCTRQDGSLLDADLRSLDLRQANLFEAELRRADLTCGTNLLGADLRQALLEDARVDSSTQIDAKWRLVWELVTSGGYLRDLPGVDLSEAILFGADMFGVDLTGANLQGAVFRSTNLFGADLSGANLTGVIWADTNCPDGSNSDNNGGTCEAHLDSILPRDESYMIGNCLIVLPVNLPNGPFTDCADAELSYTDLRQLDLRNAMLSDADLTSADLRGANLTGADLSFVDFHSVNMDETTTIDQKWRLVWSIVNRGARGQDLSGVDLSSAALDFSDLTRATLVGVNFTNTSLIGSNLTDADLTGVVWNNTFCPDGTISSNHSETCVDNLQLGLPPRHENIMVGDCLIIQPVPVNGPYTDCEGADLTDQDLRGVDLTNANLYDAGLNRADIRGAIFSGADLRMARFYGTVLDDSTRLDDKWKIVWTILNTGGQGMDLTGVDLSRTQLGRADLTGAIMNGADLTAADLRAATLEGAQLVGVIWFSTWCPDGTNSGGLGGTCIGHLTP